MKDTALKIVKDLAALKIFIHRHGDGRKPYWWLPESTGGEFVRRARRLLRRRAGGITWPWKLAATGLLVTSFLHLRRKA